MRISDWSSDVCSSDLRLALTLSNRATNSGSDLATSKSSSSTQRQYRCLPLINSKEPKNGLIMCRAFPEISPKSVMELALNCPSSSETFTEMTQGHPPPGFAH